MDSEGSCRIVPGWILLEVKVDTEVQLCVCEREREIMWWKSLM